MLYWISTHIYNPHMGSAYIKAPKRFISKDLVMKNLKLQEKEFDRLVTLCGVHPYVPKDNRKVDKGDGFYYRISDANKLLHSDVHRVLMRNKRLEERRESYIGTGFEYKINNIRYEEYGYVELVKNKYKRLGESLDGLNHTLSNLYLGRMLELDDRLVDVIRRFEDFISRKSLLEYSFMSRNVIYNQISFRNIKVIWVVPYPGAELKDIIEEKKDVPTRFEWSELNFLDFVSSDEEDEESSEMEVVVNDPDKMDISLLSYSIPLLIIHCELVLHKIESLYECHDISNKIFHGLRFYIDSKAVGDNLRLIVLNCGGEVVNDPHDADIYVSEQVDELIDDMRYVQPQYVFDCLNENSRLDMDGYCIGRILPQHISPFVSINHIIPDETLITMSKNKRNKVEDIVNMYEDVEYER